MFIVFPFVYQYCSRPVLSKVAIRDAEELSNSIREFPALDLSQTFDLSRYFFRIQTVLSGCQVVR